MESWDYKTESDQPSVIRYKERKQRAVHPCEVCGFDKPHLLGMKIAKHHIVPRALGGKADPDNLVYLCDACHDWAEVFATKARSRAQFFTLVDLCYPWPEELMKKREIDPEKIGCRLHGDWRVWVYGGVVPPRWGCTCKKGDAKAAENDTGPESGGNDTAPLHADGVAGVTT